MKLIFLMVAFMQVSAMTFAQKVNIKVVQAPLKTVFYQLSKQTGYNFMADASLSRKIGVVTLDEQNTELKQVIEKCFDGIDVEIVLNPTYRTAVIREIVATKESAVTVENQQIEVRGNIVGEEGEPLPAVSVTVKGTQTRAISDARGNFKISVPNESAVLVFSYLGYSSQEKRVGDDRNIKVKMTKLVSTLDEVVVNIGYGEVKRKDLTGAVSTVNMDDLVKAPVKSFDEALAGRIAGVQVGSNDGQPGSEMNIVIRGGNSLTQDNSPLYVVDGFPMLDFYNASLNPEEIESITILKDASATAIYGSRGANGVIIVETKKGKNSIPTVSYNGYYGVQSVTNKMDVMDPYNYVKYMLEFDSDKNGKRYLTGPGLTLEDYKDVKKVDWHDELFRNSRMHNHYVALRGGSLTTKYSMSASYMNQEGIVLNSGYERYNTKFSIEQTIGSRLKTNVNFGYTQDKNYGALLSEQGNGTNAYSTYIMYNVWSYQPFVLNSGADIHNDLFIDSEDLEEESINFNPLVTVKNVLRQRYWRGLNLNGSIRYDIIPKDLYMNVRGGYSRRSSSNESFYNTKTWQGYPFVRNDRGVNGAVNTASTSDWMTEATLNYWKRVNKDQLNFTLGTSIQNGYSDNYGYRVYNVVNEELGIAGLSSGLPNSVTSNRGRNILASYLARANYNINSKYLFTASFRADGSSKFSKKNRWGYFPSGAFAWRIDQERFLKDVKEISEAKFRISYGSTGNNRVGDFVRNTTLNINDYYSFSNNTPVVVANLNNLGFDDLKWETTYQFNVGLDLSLFKDRIGVTLDYYDKVTKDLLLNASLPRSTGFNTMFMNIGKISNKGVELTLNTRNVVTKNFVWESNFNISSNKNKILELVDNQKNLLSTVSWTGNFNNSELYIAEVGKSAAEFFGYVWDGNYQYDDFIANDNGTYTLKSGIPSNGSATVRPGDVKYVDQNGDGTVNEKDRVIIGRTLPLFIGGLNNNFTYKNVSLNVFLQWNYGNDIYNANRLAFEGNFGNRYMNQYASYTNRWSDENQNDTYFRTKGTGPNGRYSSRTLEDGSFLRVKTVNLSYRLPKRWTSKFKNGIYINASVQNLYTWTSYSGMDPEVSVRNSILTPGFDYSAYPYPRTITVGIKTDL